MNVVFGGNLINDLRELRQLTYNRPGLLPTKQVFVEPNSNLAAVCGKTKLRVNSLHHQAVERPGESMTPVAHDLDQIIQAIESDAKVPLIGVQWHPEYLFYLPSQLRLFKCLVKQAGSRPAHKSTV